MTSRYLAPVLALLVSACTFTPQDGGVNAGFHPPLVSKHWDVKNYALQNGTPVCAISSGYNGITLTLSHSRGDEEVVVQSTRMMNPGATLTVNVGGERFEAYDTFFPAKVGPQLLQSLLKGDKAYLEWSEFSGPSGRERTHVQNIVQLDDFAGHVKECRDSLRQH